MLQKHINLFPNNERAMWLEVEIVIISQTLFLLFLSTFSLSSTFWKSNKNFNWHFVSSTNYLLQLSIHLEKYSKLVQPFRQQRKALKSSCFHSTIIDCQFMFLPFNFLWSSAGSQPSPQTAMKIYFNFINSAIVSIHSKFKYLLLYQFRFSSNIHEFHL